MALDRPESGRSRDPDGARVTYSRKPPSIPWSESALGGPRGAICSAIRPLSLRVVGRYRTCPDHAYPLASHLLSTPMSTKKSGNGTDLDADTDHLRTVTSVLRRIAGDGERVSLSQIARESGLTRLDAEQAMCNIERVSPVSAKRVVESGAGVAWEVSL